MTDETIRQFDAARYDLQDLLPGGVSHSLTEILTAAQIRQAAMAAANDEAETDLRRVETRKAEIGEAAAIVALESQKISLASNQRTTEELAASDDANHRYFFTGDTNKDSIRKCIERMSTWSRRDPGCDIELFLCSPGGSVFDGMALYDFLIGLRGRGHNVTTVALGYAASMAGIILQAGTTRLMGTESYVLIHEVSAGAIGKVGEMEDKVDLLKVMCRRVVDIFVARSGLTPEVIHENWRRKDWWLDSSECLSLGIVDGLW